MNRSLAEIQLVKQRLHREYVCNAFMCLLGWHLT